MNYILRVIHGEERGAEYALQPGKNLVGRSQDAHFRLKDTSISRKQCHVIWENDGLFVQNLSSGGTQVGNRNLVNNEMIAIEPDQIIKIGDETELQLVMQTADDEAVGNVQDNGLGATIRLGGKATIDDNDLSSSKTVHSKNIQDDSDKTVCDSSKNDDGGKTVYFGKKDDNQPEKQEPEDIDKTVRRKAPENNDGGSFHIEGSGNIENPQQKEDTDKRVHKAAFVNDGQSTIRIGAQNNAQAKQKSEAPSASSEAGGDTVKITPKGKTKKADPKNPKHTVTMSGQATKTMPFQTQSGPVEFPDDDEKWWEKILHTVWDKWFKWAFIIVVLLIFFVLYVKLQSDWKRLVPENRVDFKYIWNKKTQARKPDIVLQSAFSKEQEMAFPQASKEEDKAQDKKESPLFYVIYPSSPKATVELENDDNLQIIRTFLGRNGNLPLNMFLSREQNREFLLQGFDTAKAGVKAKLEKENGLIFDDGASDFTAFLFSEDKGDQNGLRYWQSMYKRDESWRQESSAGHKADETDNVQANVLSDIKAWYGVLRFFRNKDVHYVLRVEVPEYMKDRAEQFLMSNTFLRFPIDDLDYNDNAFIALCWSGDHYRKTDSRHLVETFRSFKDSFSKQDNPRLYAEQETRLKQFLALARYDHNSRIEDEAFKLFRQLRMNRQRNYYNQLRLQWLDSIGTKDETVKQRQIRNDAELVFSNADDARYIKVRRNDWGK